LFTAKFADIEEDWAVLIFCISRALRNINPTTPSEFPWSEIGKDVAVLVTFSNKF